MPIKQQDSVKIKFINYLSSLGLSPESHKNYRSDLSHFLGWAILRIRSIGSYIESLSEAVPFLSSELGVEYKSYLSDNAIPVRTINRRLSTLRHLSKFLLESQILDFDFMNSIENVSLNSDKKPEINPVIGNFKSYLEAEKVSPNTIKNYLSDIKHFINWLDSNQTIHHPAN